MANQFQELLTKEIGSLYGQYETRFYYWECIEMIKKMMLTGGLVLLAPGSSAQILLGILITLVYLCLVLKFEPYNEDEDDFLQFVATITILLTLISGLALRSDDVNKGYYESHLMASLLILINCCYERCFHVAATGTRWYSTQPFQTCEIRHIDGSAYTYAEGGILVMINTNYRFDDTSVARAYRTAPVGNCTNRVPVFTPAGGHLPPRDVCVFTKRHVTYAPLYAPRSIHSQL